MGVPFTAAHGVIRFSMSHENSDADVDRLLDIVPGVIAKLRGLSPFWSESGAPPTQVFMPV